MIHAAKSPSRPIRRLDADGILDLVADEMRSVETALAARMESPVGVIPEVGAHLLQAGGKRLRPLLAVLAARACDVPIELATAVGTAAELIHTATLYHDDVVDDGRVRRGRPAARMVYGNGVVVLVGDFCLARALETVALTGSLAAVQSLAATVTEMAEGEVAQLERAGNPESSADDYFRVIDRKTASLFAWCARVGGGLGRSARRAARTLWAGARPRLPDRGRRARLRRRRGHRRQVGRARHPGGQGHPARPLRLRERSRPAGAGARARWASERSRPKTPRCILAATAAAGGIERARAKARELAAAAVAELARLRPSALPRRPGRSGRSLGRAKVLGNAPHELFDCLRGSAALRQPARLRALSGGARPAPPHHAARSIPCSRSRRSRSG